MMMKTRCARLAPMAAVLGAMAVSLTAAAVDECVPGWIPDVGPIGPDSGLAGGMAYHDDGNGSEVFIGGSFTTIGGAAAPRIVKVQRDKFDELEFIPLGSGLSNAECYALASFQGSLYAAGYFDLAGGVPGTAKLARWDGQAWNSIGAQLELFSNQLWGLTVWNSGQGDNLYIAGNFQNIGGTSASYIARYDGKSFHALGSTPIAGNVPLIIFTSHVHDDGTGPALYVGGRFTSIDGVAASRIARWNGTSWEQWGGGANNTVFNALRIAEPSGDILALAGQFTTIGTDTRNRIAAFEGCPEVVSTPGDLNGDGVVNGGDITILLAAWGTADAAADLNGDGIVNASDLTALLGFWG